MKYNVIALILIFCAISAFGQKKSAFHIYNKKGKKVSYNKLLKKVKKNDLILFGELHNNPIAHWLQLELTKDLHETNKLILGAEMFEADNQEAMDKYLQGEIDYIREALLMYGFPSIGNLMPGCTMQDTKDTLETLNKLIR